VLDRRGFRAVAAFYPHCSPLQNISPLKSGVIVFAGEKDDWTPAFSCTIAKGIDRMPGADFELIVYPEAVHGFDLDIQTQTYIRYLVGYNAYAASDSRDRMLAFFKRHILSPDSK
jgi:dienelactone hydrolase